MSTYYIATYGADAAGRSGANTSGQQFQTLGYAISKASSGDIIHIIAGTYSITNQITVPAGISIEGDGSTSLLNVSYNGYALLLSSGYENTNGNQHIKNIAMVGGSANSYNGGIYAAPILVSQRSNVEIANCNFRYFSCRGPRFIGTTIDGSPASYWATGNTFHDNVVLDCCNFVGIGDSSGSGQGGLEIGGQKGMLIYSNTITVGNRPSVKNGFAVSLTGYNIKYANSGYNKGLKIYNNTFYSKQLSLLYNDFNFSMELWNCRGGIEIYGNNINGGIDMSGDNPITCNDAGGYGFAAKIHNNNIGWTSWQPNEQIGVYLERSQTGGMYIYSNNFNYISTPIYTNQMYDARAHDVLEYVYIYSNIATNIGYITQHWDSNFFLVTNSGGGSIIYRYIYIINNTAVQGNNGGAGTESFVNLHIAGTGSNITVQNNIIVGFGAAAGAGYIGIDCTHLQSLTHFTLQNNLLYQNFSNEVQLYYGTTTIQYDVNTGKIVGNPLLVSATDLHLNSTSSPAYHAGVHITVPFTIPYDFQGNNFGSTPSIGAYEYGATGSVAITGITVTSAGAATTIASAGGTLQMGATIAPTNASNQTLTWSVIAGSGSGNISTSGLLTAVTNGTVSVRADSTDGSGIYGTKTITFSNQTATALATGILAYYKLDETSGNALDSVSNNDGTVVGSVTRTANGVIGGAYNFDGSTGYLSMPVNQIEPTTGMSTTFWFKSVAANTNESMVSNVDYDTSWEGWDLEYKGTYGDIQMHIYDGTAGDNFLQSIGVGTNINDGNWHFVAMIKTATTIIGWLDNVKYGPYTWAHDIHYSAASSLRVGAGNDFFGGSLDEIGIWGRPLSDAEMNALWNNGYGYQYPFSVGGVPLNIIKVTSIAVTTSTGINTITTAGGQLQMIATVSPSNATNKTVIWNVTDITGDATIDSSGLLTSIANGDVLVVATAADSI